MKESSGLDSRLCRNDEGGRLLRFARNDKVVDTRNDKVVDTRNDKMVDTRNDIIPYEPPELKLIPLKLDLAHGLEGYAFGDEPLLPAPPPEGVPLRP